MFVTALVVSLLGVGLFAGGSVATTLTLADPGHPSASICASDSVGQPSTDCTVPATTGFSVDDWRTVSGWTPFVFGDVLAVAAWGVVPLAAETLTALVPVGASLGQQRLSGLLATALTTAVVGGL